jgi:hypothetical protein
VKKYFFTIIFLISAIVLIAHGAIPHHHLDIDEYESVISHTKNSHDDHARGDNDHKHPIPSHQHVIAPDDFISRRTNVSIQNDVKFSLISTIRIITLPFISGDKILSNHSFKVIKFVPDSYPFIISPNSMRGSPVKA